MASPSEEINPLDQLRALRTEVIDRERTRMRGLLDEVPTLEKESAGETPLLKPMFQRRRILTPLPSGNPEKVKQCGVRLRSRAKSSRFVWALSFGGWLLNNATPMAGR